MKGQLQEILAKAFTPVPTSSPVEPEPTLGFDRVMQQAMVARRDVERHARGQR
jgi:hypothetical protein